MTDKHDADKRIPYFVNPPAHYLPDTPEWAKLAAEFGIVGRKPIAGIAVPGSGALRHFGVQIVLRANYQGVAFGDKVLRLRVFKFGQSATTEMIMAVDVSNPAQPFIEWPVWAQAPPALVMHNIPATQWVKEAKALAPGFALLLESFNRMLKQTREDELTKEQFRPMAIEAAKKIGRERKKLSHANLGKELLFNRDTISKYLKRDQRLNPNQSLWDELVKAHREAIRETASKGGDDGR